MMKERIDAGVFTRLKDNDSSLSELDLSDQKLHDSDIQALLQALAQNTCLTTLNVSGNQIGAEGAKVLAQNTRLTTLNVERNAIGAEGAKALAQNTVLTTLDVANNQIGSEEQDAL
jgi:Ran GTPase-activating protein (RanGAP) involved in mRNA processing and transport